MKSSVQTWITVLATDKGVRRSRVEYGNTINNIVKHSIIFFDEPIDDGFYCVIPYFQFLDFTMIFRWIQIYTFGACGLGVYVCVCGFPSKFPLGYSKHSETHK